MHRFFIPRPYAENMMIDGIDARHIYTVLKMKPGEKVQIVSDDGVTALAEITETAPGQTLVKCLEVIAESHEPAVKITLAQVSTQACRWTPSPPACRSSGQSA